MDTQPPPGREGDELNTVPLFWDDIKDQIAHEDPLRARFDGVLTEGHWRYGPVEGLGSPGYHRKWLKIRAKWFWDSHSGCPKLLRRLIQFVSLVPLDLLHDKIVNDYMTNLELDLSAGQVDERGRYCNLDWEAGVTKWARGNIGMRVQEGDWFISGVDAVIVVKMTLGQSAKRLGAEGFEQRFPNTSPSFLL